MDRILIMPLGIFQPHFFGHQQDAPAAIHIIPFN
jgi:hypothetical protein